MHRGVDTSKPCEITLLSTPPMYFPQHPETIAISGIAVAVATCRTAAVLRHEKHYQARVFLV